MIIIRLIGGLGNQMFQYAAARALADRHRVELLLDLRGFETYPLHTYGLQRFKVRAHQADLNTLASFPNWGRRIARYFHKIGLQTRYYIEPFFSFNPNWGILGDGLHLNGYFQSEKYFSKIKTALFSDFQLVADLSPINLDIAESAKSCESVSIHIRRGDYVSNTKTLAIHGVCSLAYYHAAIEHVRATCGKVRIFVFSNDMDWVRDNLSLGEEAVHVEGNAEQPEIDMFLMSQCRHNIIANSSFSWWGAWLNQTPDNVVIYPQKWFNDPHICTKDLFPEPWVSI